MRRAAAPKPPPAPTPDAEWLFAHREHGATARVYLANSKMGLVRPVILSDGFNAGPTDFDVLWHDLNGREFAFADELRRRGYDLVLLGYDERSASILENAQHATHCVLRAVAERLGGAPLTVGGFSMGGLITRYALARMELQAMDHQASTYLSFDSPHRGASIPVSLQALAHFLKPVAPALSNLINSPAARQLLWRHLETVDGEPAQDPMRTEFLAALQQVGGWPRRPRTLAVANGREDQQGNGVPAGALALEVTKGGYKPTTLYSQSKDPAFVVAHLKDLLREKHVQGGGVTEVDGASGGMLDSFAIAAENLTMPLLGSEAVAHIPAVCFVPTISAVSAYDISEENLTKPIVLENVDVDDFLCASENELHSKMTPELGRWILDRLPR